MNKYHIPRTRGITENITFFHWSSLAHIPSVEMSNSAVPLLGLILNISGAYQPTKPSEAERAYVKDLFLFASNSFHKVINVKSKSGRANGSEQYIKLLLTKGQIGISMITYAI